MEFTVIEWDEAFAKIDPALDCIDDVFIYCPVSEVFSSGDKLYVLVSPHQDDMPATVGVGQVFVMLITSGAPHQYVGDLTTLYGLTEFDPED